MYFRAVGWGLVCVRKEMCGSSRRQHERKKYYSGTKEPSNETRSLLSKQFLTCYTLVIMSLSIYTVLMTD